MSQNLSKDEFIAFQNLSKNKNLIIQKSDKENSVVTVDRHDYIKKMENILSDQNKFTRVNLKDNILLNFAVIQEKRVDQVLKNLFDSNRMVGKKNRKLLEPVVSRPGVVYCLCKVHKAWTISCHFDRLYK